MRVQSISIRWLGVVVCSLMLFGGCVLKHEMPLTDEGVAFLTSRSLPEDQYQRVALVHAEFWTVGFFYGLPVLSDGPQHLKIEMLKCLQQMESTHLCDATMTVETHMPFFGLFGWIEYHGSAMAVRMKWWEKNKTPGDPSAAPTETPAAPLQERPSPAGPLKPLTGADPLSTDPSTLSREG